MFYMIPQGAYLNVVDNSGARLVCCLKVINGYKKRYAHIGDIVIVSVKRLRAKRRSASKVQKGSVMKAIILHTKKEPVFKDGYAVSFFTSSVALLNRQGKPLATRILCGIPRSFRYSKYMRLVSLSSGLIK
jgi:large subunit ribosomal protein L14